MSQEIIYVFSGLILACFCLTVKLTTFILDRIKHERDMFVTHLGNTLVKLTNQVTELIGIIKEKNGHE